MAARVRLWLRWRRSLLSECIYQSAFQSNIQQTVAKFRIYFAPGLGQDIEINTPLVGILYVETGRYRYQNKNKLVLDHRKVFLGYERRRREG